MEDSSAVLMESLKVGLAGFGWFCRLDNQVMGISLLEASEFSARSPKVFLQIHLHKAVWELSPMQEDVQFWLVWRFCVNWKKF